MLRSELRDGDDQELRRCKRKRAACIQDTHPDLESLRSLAKFGELVDDSAVFYSVFEGTEESENSITDMGICAKTCPLQDFTRAAS